MTISIPADQASYEFDHLFEMSCAQINNKAPPGRTTETRVDTLNAAGAARGQIEVANTTNAPLEL